MRFGRGLFGRRLPPPDLRYGWALGGRSNGPYGDGPYGAAKARRRARLRRRLWWGTLVVVGIVVLCCAGMVVSQISFGGSPGPAPGHSPTRR